MIGSEMIPLLRKQNHAYWIALSMKMLHGLGWFLVFPIMPVHARQLGASPLIVGLLMATPAIFQMSIPLLGGTITAQLGKKRMFRWAFTAGILSAGVYFAAPQYLWLFLGQVLLGTSHAFFEPCFGAHLADLAGPEETSRLLGFAMGLHAINAMVGPATAGYLIHGLNPGAVFMLYLFIMCLGLGLAYFLPATDSIQQDFRMAQLISTSRQDNRIAVRSKAVRFALFSSWTMFISWAVFDSFFPIYTEDLGHSVRLLGLFLMIRGVASAVVRFTAGPLVNLLGLKKLISAALLTSSFSFVALPFISSPMAILGISLMSGIAPGIIPVASAALIAEGLPRRHRPVGMALNQTFVGFGRLTGSSVFGYVTETQGSHVTFTSAAAVIAICTAALAAIGRTPAGETEEDASEPTKNS